MLTRAFDLQGAAVFYNYSMRNGETKPGALAKALGRKERIDHIMVCFFIYARAVINKGGYEVLIIKAGR